MLEEKVVVTNKAGMHARPAAMLVKAAGNYKSEIKLSAKGKTVSLKSVMGIMTLGLKQGTEVVIQANGEDEAAALAEIKGMFEAKFGEE